MARSDLTEAQENSLEPLIETGKQITLSPSMPAEPGRRYTRAKIAIAFGVAAVSDVLSIWITFALPLQLTLDLATALALFWILGRRWVLLPGFVAEAIPGVGMFPVWILVVLSIILYDGFKRPHK